MKTEKFTLLIVLFFMSLSSYATSDITVRRYKLGRTLSLNEKIDGEINVELKLKNDKYGKKITTSKNFYGVDLHGFAKTPHQVYVLPLKAGHFRWGGNLHSVYNWKLNNYYDEEKDDFYYVYAPVDYRVKQIQELYKANPLLQVNLMGWQPTEEGNLLVLKRSADEAWAADQLLFLNLEKRVALRDILIGNEPFLWDDTHSKIWQGHSPSADEYIERFVNYVLALRAAQEQISGNPNDIRIWGPEMSTGWVDWQTMNPADCVENGDLPQKMTCSYGDGKFSNFVPYFLSRISEVEKDVVKNPKGYKLLDFLTFHYYPLFRKDFADDKSIILDSKNRQDVKAMLESTNIWNNPDYVNLYDGSSPKGLIIDLVSKFAKWRDEYYPTALLALTEYGVDSKVSIPYHPIVRPLYLADLMARIREAGIDIFVKSFLKNGNRGSVNGWALIDSKGKKTPLYNIYQMYSNYYLGDTLNVNDSFSDEINAYGVFYDKKIQNRIANYVNVFVVNKYPTAKNVKVQLSKVGNSVKQGMLELKLSPWSLSLIQLPTNENEEIVVKQYGAKEMGINIGSYEE